MKNTNKSILATNLIRYRKQLGLTQAQISNAINIERSRYAHYEKETTPTANVLRKLAAVLNVSTDQLLFEKKENPHVNEDPSPSLYLENYLFNELKDDEKQIVMQYRLLSEESKNNVKKFIADRRDKEDYM